jgi:ArsR family transcriptional regulator
MALRFGKGGDRKLDDNAWDNHAVVFGWRPTKQFSYPVPASENSISDPQLIAVLAALGNGFRLNLWRLLLPFGSDGLPAGTIAARMRIVPSSLSFHLRQMTHAGVLVQRRTSRQIIYAVNQDIIDAVVALLVAATSSSDALLAEPDTSVVEPGNFIGEGHGERERLGD